MEEKILFLMIIMVIGVQRKTMKILLFIKTLLVEVIVRIAQKVIQNVIYISR